MNPTLTHCLHHLVLLDQFARVFGPLTHYLHHLVLLGYQQPEPTPILHALTHYLHHLVLLALFGVGHFAEKEISHSLPTSPSAAWAAVASVSSSTTFLSLTAYITQC